MADLLTRRIQNLPLNVVCEIKQDPADQRMKLKGEEVHRVRTYGEWRPLRFVFPTGTHAQKAQDELTRKARSDETRVSALHHSFWLLPGDGSRILVTTQHINDTVMSKEQEKSLYAYPICVGCQLAHIDELAAAGTPEPEATKGLPSPLPKDADTSLPTAHLRVVGTVLAVANAATPTLYIQASRIDILPKQEWVNEFFEACCRQNVPKQASVDLLHMLNNVDGIGNKPPAGAPVLLSMAGGAAGGALEENRAAKAGVSVLAQRIFALKGSPKLVLNPDLGAFSIASLVDALPATADVPATTDQVKVALEELVNVEPSLAWFIDDEQDHFDWL
jgi:hypothetical protein